MDGLRELLADEGLLQKTAKDPLEELGVKALNLVAKEAKLPVTFKGWKSQSVKVPVPKGFESLFAEITLEVSLRGDWALIRWGYNHPYNHGSNGLSFAQVQLDRDRNKAGWRIDGSRLWGELDL